jgi:flagellar motor switch protein FliM
MRLADVVAFKPGDRLVLGTTVGAPVQVRCGTVPLFQAHVGRRKNKVAVRIETPLERKPLPQPEA